MPSRRERGKRRRPSPLSSLAGHVGRGRGAVLWSAALASATYAGYRMLSRPFRPANHRLALFLGKQLMEAGGPCLAVTTRPLELERFVGGTLRRMVLAGVPVVVAVITPGNAPDASFKAQDDEALEAAHRIGYHRLQMLKVPAPFQERDVERSLEEVWTEVEPEVVVAFDPLDPLGWIDLPEERICGEAVLRLSERLDRGHRVKLAFCGTRRPNALVDVTPILSDKINAVLSHRTELSVPALAVNLGLRLVGRLPDLRGSFEAVRLLEPARRAAGQPAPAEQQSRGGSTSHEPGRESLRKVRRALVRTRIPAETVAAPASSGYWTPDASTPAVGEGAGAEEHAGAER